MGHFLRTLSTQSTAIHAVQSGETTSLTASHLQRGCGALPVMRTNWNRFMLTLYSVTTVVPNGAMVTWLQVPVPRDFTVPCGGRPADDVFTKPKERRNIVQGMQQTDQGTHEIGRAHVWTQSHHDIVCRLLLEKKKKETNKKKKRKKKKKKSKTRATTHNK